ncbi:multi-sensor hybrid histidine kinase [Tolypothrix tenuis PCC 7101]|uniref:histidine kinase n=1 Tax=Tolypothrix tenuis PCC 7101 TaxID=231146 RepID=A0A1Z4N336_9CYAN|nr:CHASE domain-containing protein [Aulosira sp. FACHB-113]BAZ00127.1 multi-sensor hybrid histidine kinase [Tolypothrix tenuis PCC 7101]BAZ75952.1 multi-sensor hybrid histidine kinase [Aulosira laxa NIES-50]
MRSHLSWKSANQLPAWTSYVVLLGTLLLTAGATGLLEITAATQDKLRFQNAVTRTQDNIQSRLDTYITLLRAGSALFAANENVSLAEFRAFVERLNLKERYPGIQGIGFSKRVSAKELPGLLNDMQKQGVKNFNLRPNYNRNEYHSIIYLEPLDRRNQAAIGYDMYTEVVRRAAMESARDGGTVAASGKVTLVQEIDQHKQAGFLIYIPVYRQGIIPNTIGERQANLLGFIYSPYRADDLLQGIFGGEQPLVNFDIYDGKEIKPNNLLHTSKSNSTVNNSFSHPQFQTTHTIKIAGRNWTIVFQSQPEMDLLSSRNLVPYIGFTGVVISFILFGITRSLNRARNAAETSAAALGVSQAALLESEKRFRRLVESNIFGVACTDFEGNIKYANEYFLRMLGYTIEDMVAGTIHPNHITPAEYLSLDNQAITELRNHGVAAPFEKEFIRKDGTRIPILIGSALIQASASEPEEIITFYLDLTIPKQIEAILRQKEEQLRLITNAVPVFISYIDNQQCYRFNNKKYAEWYGVASSELHGKHIKEVVGEATYKTIRPYIETVLSGETVTYEVEISPPDGSSRYIQGAYVPHFSPDGTVEGFVALISDITESKQAQKALQQSEERFRKLTEKARVIPWQADAQTGNFTYVGPQSEEILGYPVIDWYADNFWQAHIHPDDQEWAVQYCIESSLTLDNYEFEYRMLAADGRVVWIYDIVNVLREEGKPQILHGFMIDITDRKLSEQERERLLAEAEAANRMKDEFLGTLSHELRTPLNAMLGWTQLLRSRRFDETTTARALETIDRNTKSLAQLIEDVLDVSRIIQGKLSLNLQQVELVPLVEAAIETVYPAADAKEIRIECRFAPDVGIVIADVNRLQQIIWNLLSNAVKFTPKGGKVEVQLQRINSRVQIRVSDNGSGIPPEFLPFVFDRFRQADSSSTRSHGGLGLGLAIVRHLVELHGGTVSAESLGIGKGATFTVNLPMKAVAINNTTSPHREPLINSDRPNEPQTLNGVRVLVVDDEPDARQLLTTVLSPYGAQVMTAASATEALAAVPQFHPDVLVSDIGMPKEDGYVLIRQLRALPPEQGGRIPAVALTAYARSEDRTQALLAGFQLHIPKPVNPAELVAVIANLTGRT